MKNSRKAGNKGFTLIELLVVIAIIAVLAVVVILTLNPAALLQEARDANRVSDMATLKSALSLYLADVNPVQLAAPGGTATTSMDCWVSMAQATGWRLTVTSNSNTATSPANSCAQFFPDASTAGFVQTSSAANQRLLNGSGWIPVNFTNISAGAPFGQLPIDPTNGPTGGAANPTNFYAYTASTTSNTFKVAMFMESTKYENGGAGDVVSSDGGVNNYVFEGGSNLSL